MKFNAKTLPTPFHFLEVFYQLKNILTTLATFKILNAMDAFSDRI
jgi:hypothetical protein